MIWKRRSKLDLGRYVAPEFSEDAPLSIVIDDAMALAIAGVRLAVKNIIIVRTLRDHKDYDDDFYLTAIGHEFEALAREKDHDAARVRAAITAAQAHTGRSRHPSDYVPTDVDRLHRREEMLVGLSARLREVGAEHDSSRQVLNAARRNALDEIAQRIGHVQGTYLRTSLPDRERTIALAELAADLRRMKRVKARH